MAKLPDGMIIFFKPYKTEIWMEHQELIMCKNCKQRNQRTGICMRCNDWVEEYGYCLWAEKRQEEVVALEFSTDLDNPSRYQTSDGEWHEGMIRGD